MTELQAIGLVNIQSIQGYYGGKPQKLIELKDKFDWFLDDEFTILRDSYTNSQSTEKHPCVLVNQNHDYERSILLNSTPPRTEIDTTHTPIFVWIGKVVKYDYSCYKCKKDNHGIDVYQTNSKSEYEDHWLKHNIKTTCYPNKTDLEFHAWQLR